MKKDRRQMSSRFNASKQNIEIETLPALKGECHLFWNFYRLLSKGKLQNMKKSKHLLNETVEI